MNLYVMRSAVQADGLRDMIRATDLWGTPFCMAEIGSFAGESAEIFLEEGAGVLCAVDLWAPIAYRENVAENIRPDLAEEEFDRRTRRPIWRVVKFKMSSQEAANLIPDGYLDLFYIDAEHTFDAVTRDIVAWLPKLRAGGWASGHDWSWPGVGDAVRKFLGHFGEPRIFQDDSWLVQVQ
jgi:hypothetical protein